MLPKKRRLPKESIQKVIKEGRNFYCQNLSLKYLNAPSHKSAFSFIISAKIVKSAVERNKLKRKARTSLLKILPGIKENFLAVIFLGKESGTMKFSEMEKTMKQLFKKAGLLICII